MGNSGISWIWSHEGAEGLKTASKIKFHKTIAFSSASGATYHLVCLRGAKSPPRISKLAVAFANARCLASPVRPKRICQSTNRVYNLFRNIRISMYIIWYICVYNIYTFMYICLCICAYRTS